MAATLNMTVRRQWSVSEGEAAGVQHTLKNSEKRISTAEAKEATDHA